MTDVLDNILNFRDSHGWTNAQLADCLGVHPSLPGKWEAGTAYPTRNKFSLFAKAMGMTLEELTGSDNRQKLTSVNKSSKGAETVIKKVPLYDAIAVGGNSMLADQSPISEPIDMVDPGDLLRSATGLLVVRGQSMFPKYPSGCYVAFKKGGEKIPAVIVWGEDYVIELEDRRILKRVEKGETKEHIRAVSYNVNKDNKYVYDPIDIHRKDVKRMYMVLGKVELEASI